MENKNEMESGFRVLNIVMMDLAFSRVPKVTFNDVGIENNITVNVGCQFEDNKVIVNEDIYFSQEFGQAKEYSVSVKMIGVFEVVGQPKLDPIEFGNVHGPAIIFPYVREIITSTCLKAGLGAVFVPPFDFTKKGKQV